MKPKNMNKNRRVVGFGFWEIIFEFVGNHAMEPGGYIHKLVLRVHFEDGRVTR